MERRLVRFPGATGAQLAARVVRPPGPPPPWVLFAHCFTCSKDLRSVRRIADVLAGEGFGVLSFDFTGLGDSEGEFAETDFTSNIEDLVAASSFMARELGPPELLLGHSLGGSAVIGAAGRIASVRAVATIGALADPAELALDLEQRAPELVGRDEAEVLLAGRTFRIQQRLLDDLRAARLDAAVRGLGRPLLVLHSPTDEVVDVSHAERLFALARHPKSFVALDGADHLLLVEPRDPVFVARVVARWAARYVAEPPTAQTTLPDPAEALPHGRVHVEIGPSGFETVVRAGRHVLRADEPERHGGRDTGPSPYEYLLASLGTCTAMTLRMYADRKQWPLERVRVRLRHDKVHAEDCAECETREGRVDVIEREIVLEGPLDDVQRQRLREIADRCPVHRTLTSEIHIRTRLA